MQKNSAIRGCVPNLTWDWCCGSSPLCFLVDPSPPSLENDGADHDSVGAYRGAPPSFGCKQTSLGSSHRSSLDAPPWSWCWRPSSTPRQSQLRKSPQARCPARCIHSHQYPPALETMILLCSLAVASASLYPWSCYRNAEACRAGEPGSRGRPPLPTQGFF